MTKKTIHIHLHPAKARDAGFDESKHKRDHGKFSTTTSSAPLDKYHTHEGGYDVHHDGKLVGHAQKSLSTHRYSAFVNSDSHGDTSGKSMYGRHGYETPEEAIEAVKQLHAETQKNKADYEASEARKAKRANVNKP